MKKLNKAQLQKLILREQKQLIKENFLLKIVDHIKKVVDDGRLKQARKDALDIDPELAQKIKNVESSLKELEDWAEINISPEAKASATAWRDRNRT